MIGVTKDGRVLEITQNGPMVGRGLVALLITDPDELPSELIVLNVGSRAKTINTI